MTRQPLSLTVAKELCNLQTASLSLILLGVAIAVGCSTGPKLFPATGTVEYEGKPVAGAEVVFVPDHGRPATAVTDDQGKFSLVVDGRPGALQGSYKVSVRAVRQIKKLSDAEMAVISPEAAAANIEWLIPQEYSSILTSGLTATVTDDPAKNVFHFRLAGHEKR